MLNFIVLHLFKKNITFSTVFNNVLFLVHQYKFKDEAAVL